MCGWLGCCVVHCEPLLTRCGKLSYSRIARLFAIVTFRICIVVLRATRESKVHVRDDVILVTNPLNQAFSHSEERSPHHAFTIPAQAQPGWQSRVYSDAAFALNVRDVEK